MPYVNIKITKEENVTPEQKEKLISGETQLLFDVLGKNPKSMVVMIDEVDTDNCSFEISKPVGDNVLKNKSKIFLTEVKQHFNSAVWSHKIHEKQADIYAENYKF